MSTAFDTRLLMDDFMQRNEKLKSMIGESLPSKEKRMNDKQKSNIFLQPTPKDEDF